jgi:hypothetical protein
LRGLIAAHQQQYQRFAASGEINAVTRTAMNAQFANAFADRFNVAKIAIAG